MRCDEIYGFVCGLMSFEIIWYDVSINLMFMHVEYVCLCMLSMQVYASLIWCMSCLHDAKYASYMFVNMQVTCWLICKFMMTHYASL